MIYFLTSNNQKFIEASKILKRFDIEIEQIKFDLDEIQGTSYDVIQRKLEDAVTIFPLGQLIVEDVSLFFNEWNGLPGPFIKSFLDSIGVKKLPGLLKNDFSAKALTSIGYYDGKDYNYFSGSIDGTIVLPRGENTWGWDEIFQPHFDTRTFAQMDPETKNGCSDRFLAFEKLGFYIKNNL